MNYTLLTLGDSYTIGEGVHLSHTYPYKTIRNLRSAGKAFVAAEVIAHTGWTTFNLMGGISGGRLLPEYDFVSLLIGVNDQYQGLGLAAFENGFTILLRQAIGLAGGDPARVIVLSIPDWSITPFATTYLPDDKGRDQAFVSKEIDDFNMAVEKHALTKGAGFIDITTHSRSFSVIPEGLSPFAADGLHPSGLQYDYWANWLAEKILKQLA